jgi:hypothetical protein
MLGFDETSMAQERLYFKRFVLKSEQLWKLLYFLAAAEFCRFQWK